MLKRAADLLRLIDSEEKLFWGYLLVCWILAMVLIVGPIGLDLRTKLLIVAC
jgi:hypothetical protein